MKIAIGADISVMKDCEQLFDKCCTKELFGNVTDAFQDCHSVIVNLECALTDKDTPIKKIGPNLKAPLNTAKVLRDAGITHCTLSNNHIFDYGVVGIRDTLEQLDKYGISYTGFGINEKESRKSLILSDGKIKVAIIAVCEHEYSYALENRMGARPYDPYDTNDDIVEAKRSADYVIVMYHGGKEDCRYPSPRLLKACRSMVKHGADVVLCQHSHCIGCYEQFMQGHILYGQGNFHFICKDFENPQDGGYMWNTGLLVKLELGDEIDLEFVPCVVDGTSIRLSQGEERERILSELYERSKSISDGTWRDHWQKFASSQERYRIVPKELLEEVAHYIDCEAHSDVWREIYKTYNSTNELE